MKDTSRESLASLHAVPLVNERALELFRLLVEEYLQIGTPIGSRHIADKARMRVSSATVRNVMADLEDKGLVKSPHTSAGKLPTNRGLRFFVDHLIAPEPLETTAETLLRSSLEESLSPNELVESASELLAEASNLLGMVTTPRPALIEFRQIHFLPLAGSRVLAVLVVNEREVQNRVIETERAYTEVELVQAANYINREFGGHTLLDIRLKILDSMKEDQHKMNSLMQTALDVASKSFDHAGSSDHDHDYVVNGETNLIGLLSSSEEAQELLDALKSKSSILHLLDRCLQAAGVQLHIGGEPGHAPLDDYSLITARYEVEGVVAGVVGVVGPSRMHYESIIPLVNATAHRLGFALEHHDSCN